MKKVLKFLLVLLVVLVSAQQSPLLANDDKDKKEKKTKKVKKTINHLVFDEKYFDEKSNWDDANVAALRAKANSAVNETEAQQRYVDYLSPSDLNRLPIGLKKKIGNTTVKIAVSSAVFTSRYAELTVYAKIEIPQNNTSNVGSSTSSSNGKKTIFFGVQGLKLSKDGGIIGDAKLVLLGDYAIPINGGKNSLVLKGGFDINTGQGLGKTYIGIDCNGFKELGLSADIEFPRSMFIPTDASGNQIAGQVKGSFSTIVTNWNDILANISLPLFEIKGIDGVGFKIDNAVVDLSDIHNSDNIVYPAGYVQKYLGNDQSTINLWRGVYAKDIKVTLPKSFKNLDSSNRVSFGAHNLVIDNNGLTGLFYAQNILPLHKGSAGGWQFSVDSFTISLEANRLLRAGFGGRLGLPINKEATAQVDADSVARRKYLAYSAIMTSSGDYLCRVITKDSISFDVWKANVILKPNSYIELAGNKEKFRPSAMLHGSMNISSKTGTSGNERTTKILDFKGIEFQGLHIKTELPYITAQYFGYNGTIKLGILPVSVENIALKNYTSTELGVGFGLKVNLQDSSFSGSTRVYVVGKYNPDQGGIASWKYDRLEVENISIHAKIGNVSLDGSIEFLDDNIKYGDGFRGQITMKIDKPAITVGVTAIFGNKGFRFWFVDGFAEFPSIGTGIINIDGFGGGAYYRMRKEGFDPTLSPTGLEYVPDSTAGLGLRASVMFNVAKKELDHGQATLEIAFNRHGGMRFMGLYGYAKIMSPLKPENLPGGGITSFVKEQFGKIENTMKGWSPAKLDSNITKKIFQPTAAADEMWKSNIPADFSVDFRAVMGISYDFNNNVFHANFDLFVSTPGNVLTGVGAGGRAGWAVLHVDPTKWYMHMGTPTDPIGIKIALGPLSVQTSSYFMMGHDLPAFPPLPAPLQSIMAQNNMTYQSNIDIESKDKIKSGEGLAFGAGVHVATGDIKFLILYANFQAGMGFDVMIKDYSNYICQETGQKPGFNGWYAQGRVYAYLQGECGVRIKLGPIKKKIPIIQGAAVALLEARLPKPSWFGGLFAVNVRLLGGKIKINVNLKFQFGDNCTLIDNPNGGGEIDFDEFRVVTSVTPGDNSQKVSLFAKPVVSCLTTPEAPFNLPPDEGGVGGDETYRPHISSLTITKGSQSFKCSYKLSSDSSRFTVYPDTNLIAQTDYVLNIKIIYQKLVSGTWINVTNDDGSPALEATTVRFKTGDNPPYIAEDNIGFMYPYINQRFFYKNETTSGRVLLKNTQNELFASFTSWKARFIHATTKAVVAVTDVVYNPSIRSVTYGIPSQLELNNPYKIEIFGQGHVIGSLIYDTSRPILQFNFNTSRHGTLAEKFTAFQTAQPNPIVGRVESDVIDLQAKVNDYEGFDLAEMIAMPLTGNIPLIGAEAVLTDNYYYNSKIQPLLRYPYFFPGSGITISRDPNEFGLIPVKAISLSQYYLTAAQSSNYNTILYDRLPFIYDLNRIFNADFIELRNRIVNKHMANMTGAPTSPMYEWYRPCWLCSKKQRLTQEWVNYFNSTAYKQAMSTASIASIPADMKDIVTQPFPFMSKGDYKVNFQVKRAVSWNGVDNFNFENATQSSFTFHNPIESLFFNEYQSITFTKSDCNSGEQGGTVNYTIQPGTYSSTISQADANQKAINAINQYGQDYANQNGTCCYNGNCYVPGIVTINLSSYMDCYGSSSTITFSGAAGYFSYNFPTDWYGASMQIQLPSGSYDVSVSTYSSSYNTQVSMDYQTWYGNYVSAGQHNFSANNYYSISVSNSCGYYY